MNEIDLQGVVSTSMHVENCKIYPKEQLKIFLELMMYAFVFFQKI